MPKILHILLNYKCPLRCSHCYVFGSPRAKGIFRPGKVNRLLEQAKGIFDWVLFDGGEPFVYFHLLCKSIRQAKAAGFKTGVITNGYFGRDPDSSRRFLLPVQKSGLDCLLVSADPFHYKNPGKSPAQRVLQAAGAIGLPAKPTWGAAPETLRGDFPPALISTSTAPLPIGRAALNQDSKTPAQSTAAGCPNINLQDPQRVWVDPFGHVMLCPGISIGNLQEQPLGAILQDYRVTEHPIFAPLLSGGARKLAEKYNIDLAGRDGESACQLCYQVRSQIRSTLPEVLAPAQVYGA